MNKEDIEELERVLDLYRNWNEFPYRFNEETITAIEHALISNKGVAFVIAFWKISIGSSFVLSLILSIVA